MNGDRDQGKYTRDGSRYAGELIERYTDTFRTLSRRNAVNLAHRLIDEAHSAYSSDKSSPPLGCRTDDCFSCCLYQKCVDVVDYEVERILDQVERLGTLEDVTKRAQRLVEGGKGGACPLLSRDGKCTVYKNRPLSCASMHSLDRDLCKDPDGKTMHAERLWILTHILAGFGMLPVSVLESGKSQEATSDLFERLAALGAERLAKKEAA